MSEIVLHLDEMDGFLPKVEPSMSEERIKELMISWSETEISKILVDKEFVKLADLSIEDQVYLEAEKVYKDRNKKTDR